MVQATALKPAGFNADDDAETDSSIHLGGRPNMGPDASAEDLIPNVLRMLRTHLGLDVAFVSQIVGGERVFRFVDAAGAECPIEVGGADPAEESYCHYVVSGELPQFIRDPKQHPVATKIEATYTLPVGTHLSVPIVFSDGNIYGTFCCFGFDVDDSIGERDLETVRLLAAVVARYVEDAEVARRDRERRRDELRSVIVESDFDVLFQPIVTLTNRKVVGLEALSRFPGLGRGPAEVFAEAWRLGVGMEVELQAAFAAFARLDRVPDDAYVAVNLSPATLVSGRLLDLAKSVAPERIVIEITEHAAVDDYPGLVNAVAEMAEAGVRLAIDDVGTGFSGLDHILRLNPNILKIDGALVGGVDQSKGKQAMIAALVTFATRMDTRVVAERIETEDELSALRVLGVDCGQGYLLGRPEPIDALSSLTA